MGGHFGAKGSSLNDRGAGRRLRRFNYASESMYERKNARRTYNLANTKYKDVTTGSPRLWPTELLGRVCLYPQNVQRGFHTIIPSQVKTKATNDEHKDLHLSTKQAC